MWCSHADDCYKHPVNLQFLDGNLFYEAQRAKIYRDIDESWVILNLDRYYDDENPPVEGRFFFTEMYGDYTNRPKLDFTLPRPQRLKHVKVGDRTLFSTIEQAVISAVDSGYVVWRSDDIDTVIRPEQLIKVATPENAKKYIKMHHEVARINKEVISRGSV